MPDEQFHLSGQLEFGVHVAIVNEQVAGKNMWDLRLGRKQKAELTGFECRGHESCNELRDFLQDELIKKVIYQLGYDGEDYTTRNPIDDYKSPMSARMLMGVLRYINDFT